MYIKVDRRVYLPQKGRVVNIKRWNTHFKFITQDGHLMLFIMDSYVKKIYDLGKQKLNIATVKKVLSDYQNFLLEEYHIEKPVLNKRKTVWTKKLPVALLDIVDHCTLISDKEITPIKKNSWWTYIDGDEYVKMNDRWLKTNVRFVW